jgi:hypothetical protein
MEVNASLRRFLEGSLAPAATPRARSPLMQVVRQESFFSVFDASVSGQEPALLLVAVADRGEQVAAAAWRPGLYATSDHIDRLTRSAPERAVAFILPTDGLLAHLGAVRDPGRRAALGRAVGLLRAHLRAHLDVRLVFTTGTIWRGAQAGQPRDEESSVACFWQGAGFTGSRVLAERDGTPIYTHPGDAPAPQ